MAVDHHIRRLGDLQCELGESPVWDQDNDRLLLVDIDGHAIHALDPSSGASCGWPMSRPVAALGLSSAGLWIVALSDGVFTFDPEKNRLELLCQPEPQSPTNRLNDGKVGPDGAFWIGSMNQEKTRAPTAALYRVGPSADCVRVRSGLSVANGLAWSPDGGTMYHADSHQREIMAFDFCPETGSVGPSRLFAKMKNGAPDGGATDVEGCYWSCAAFGGRLVRFSPSGTVLENIELPVTAPTSLCFGSADMRTLFITSMRSGLGAPVRAREPLAGAIFALEVSTAGTPVGRFGQASPR